MLWFVAMSASACEGEREDIEIERVKLASGEYFDSVWGGTQVERFHVVAHRGTRDGEVVLISPGAEEPCSLGMLAGYETMQPLNGGKYVIGSPSPARVALFDRIDENGRGRLGFADVHCERTELEVNNVNPSQVRTLFAPDLMQLYLAVPAADGSLVFLDPWEGTEAVFAREVSALIPFDDGVWLIEDGRAVRRDLDGRVLARHGDNVRELLPLTTTGDLAYVDDSGLVLHEDGEDIVVAEDACRVRPFSSFMPGALAYFAPCDERKLQIRKKDGETLSYEPSIESLIAQPGRIFFTVNRDVEETSGEVPTTELWLLSVAAPDEPRKLSVQPRFHLDALWPVSSGRLLLAARQPDESISLWLLDPGADEHTRITPVDEGFASVRLYEDAIALVKTDGSLQLRDLGSLRELLSAQNVSNVRFIFGENDTALAYIENVDEQTGVGDLELHFLSGEHFSIAKDVREFREVWWPESGLVYAASGDEPGVYFSRVDVPCEKTSDSPWACGF